MSNVVADSILLNITLALTLFGYGFIGSEFAYLMIFLSTFFLIRLILSLLILVFPSATKSS